MVNTAISWWRRRRPIEVPLLGLDAVPVPDAYLQVEQRQQLEFISLDGIVEAPGGEDFKYPDWSFAFDRGPDGERFKEEEAIGAAALLLGRKTYEGFAEAWPQYEGELADKYNSMPKYVVSSALTDPEWNNTSVLAGDLVEDVSRLKQDVDGEISVPGSIQLAQGLLAHDLVDEIHLMSFPVILGHGRTLWTQTPDKTAWKLTEATTYGDGVLVTIYRRNR
jgi:dihydrofolate reductase